MLRLMLNQTIGEDRTNELLGTLTEKRMERYGRIADAILDAQHKNGLLRYADNWLSRGLIIAVLKAELDAEGETRA